MREVSIDEIKIGPRYRSDHGDIAALAASIKEIGLLQPIVLNPKLELIDGERRLMACGDLGWDKVPAYVIDIDSILAGEYAANEVRKDFTVSERVAIGKAIEAQLGNRQGQRTDKQVAASAELPGKCKEVQKGKETGEVAAEAAGFKSDDTYRRAKKVVEKAAPSVVKAVDEGKVSVSDAAKIVDAPKAEQAAAVKAVKAGKARTLKQAVEKKPKNGQIIANGDPREPGDDTEEIAQETLKHLADADTFLGKVARAIQDASRGGSAQDARNARTCLQWCDSLSKALLSWKKSIK